MDQDRFSNLSILYIEKDIKIDPNRICKNFLLLIKEKI